MSERTLPAVLLVDDEVSILRSLRRSLAELPVEIVTANSGEEGLKLIQDRSFALVISDQRMPGMTGDQLLGKVRELRPFTVRIVLTGYADMDAALSLINTSRIHRYISKPWDDDDLRMTVTSAINFHEVSVENHRLAAEIQQKNEQLRQLSLNLAHQVKDKTRELEERNKELEQSNHRLNENQMAVIEILTTLMEMNDPGMGGHAHRVADQAQGIAEIMGLSEAEIQSLRIAALLHDLGKVGIPSELFDKPTPVLSPEQRERLRLHGVRGQSALLPIDDFKSIGEAIRSHHERYDGEGYPDGLKGEAIPLAARIISVADEFDHLFNRSNGMPGIHKQESFSRLEREKSHHFDPKVIKALREYLGLNAEAEEKGSVWHELSIPLFELKSCMILGEDLKTNEGLLIAARGMKLSERLIQIIQKYRKSGRLNSEILVFVNSQDHMPLMTIKSKSLEETAES